MKLFCWYCHKPVSTELPEGSIFRATATCPECTEKGEGQNLIDVCRSADLWLSTVKGSEAIREKIQTAVDKITGENQ